MFKIILNQPTNEAFTRGSEVSGYLVVNEWKHKSTEAQVQICLHGHVKIWWQKSVMNKNPDGSKSRQRLVYFSELNFLTLDSPMQKSQLETNKEFPFRFILPVDKPMPSSHDGYVGSINYYVEAVISVVAGSVGPISVKAVVPFNETVDINSPALLASTVQKKEEHIYRWYSKNPSGSITVTVETPHTGYHLEESVPFTATVHNDTGSRIKMEAALLQTVSYYASDACRVYPFVIAKYSETSMPSKTTSVWNPTGVRNRNGYKITENVLVSSTCSEHVKVLHRLEVTASLPTNKTLQIEIPITIGNVPRTETSVATIASEDQEASASALPQEKLQLSPHQPPFQREVGWCLDATSNFSLSERSVLPGNTLGHLPPPEMDLTIPPTYDAAVANIRKRSIPNGPGYQTLTGLTTEAPPSYEAVAEKPSDYVKFRA